LKLLPYRVGRGQTRCPPTAGHEAPTQPGPEDQNPDRAKRKGKGKERKRAQEGAPSLAHPSPLTPKGTAVGAYGSSEPTHWPPHAKPDHGHKQAVRLQLHPHQESTASHHQTRESCPAGPELSSMGLESCPAGGPEPSSMGLESCPAGPEPSSTGLESCPAGPELSLTGLESCPAGPELSSMGLESCPAGPEPSSMGLESCPAGPELSSTGLESCPELSIRH
jgi:hypothetical protein